MDAADFLEPEELAALRPRAEAPLKETCEACDLALPWVDAAWICAAGCTLCTECAEAAGMVCPSCSGELRRRPSRARPLSG